MICALLALVMAFAHGEGRGVRLVRPLAGVSALLLVLVVLMSSSLDRQMTLWTHPHLTETRDSPYGRVTVTSLNGQISVFENDALSFETEGTDAEEFVQMAALQHPAPSRVLILGGGMDGTLREALQLKPARADYVELNRALVDIVAPLLPQVFQESLKAHNVRLHIGDPREFLVQAEKYDLILVGMPEPTSGQANRFYTSEFFQLCLRRLHPCGILAFRLQSSENLWTPQLTRRMASIYRAAKSVFADVLMLPGSTNIVICSTEPLTRNPDVLTTRLEERGVKTRLVSPAFIQYIYGNDRFRQVAETLESESAPTNTDSRPICYQYSVMFWLSKFFPSFGSWDIASVASRKSRIVSLWWLLAFALPFLYCLSRLRWPLRRALLMGSAGFIGMVLETSLILLYQVKRGMSSRIWAFC